MAAQRIIPFSSLSPSIQNQRKAATTTTKTTTTTRRSLVAKATPDTLGSQGVNTDGLVLPPETIQESISQASEAVKLYIQNGQFKKAGPKKNKGRGFKSKGAMKELMELQGDSKSSGARIALEMSMGADSAKDVAAMALGIAQVLPKPLSIRFGDKGIQKETQKANLPGVSLSMINNAKDGDENGNVLIVGAKGEQLKEVVKLTDSLGKKTNIILLNADFTPQPPSSARDFVDSFEIVYSLLPLAIQGFMSNKNGAIFRAYQDSKSFLWRAFMEEPDKTGREKWKPVG